MTLPEGKLKAPEIKKKVEADAEPVVCNDLHYSPRVPLHELEKQYILKALAFHGNNKTEAAEKLGITVKTLFNKLHEYGLMEDYRIHAKSAEA